MNVIVPNTLFKYKSFDKYTADILRNSEAFFCPASKLDDQFESAISISKKILNNDLDGYMRELLPFILEKVVPSSSEILKNIDIAYYFQNGKLNVPKFKNLVMKNDPNFSHSQLDMLVNFLNKLQNIENNKKLSKALKKLIDIKNEIGVFSMTTKPNNQPMWAWYAKGYDGYVVEYDIESYLKEHEEMYKDLKYVNYSDKRNNNPMHIILNSFYEALYRSLNIPHKKYDAEKDIESIVNTKSSDWKFQDEWRLFGKPETKAIIPIKAVYIGVNASEANRDFIIKVAKEKGFRVYQQLNDCESTDIEFELLF